ncbi:MAG: NAD-dependent epimerase [Pseudomonadota bacterium]
MRVMVTGVAGFIGFHVAIKLLERGDTVVGVDNLNDYYDVGLKQSRLDLIAQHANAGRFSFIKLDLADIQATADMFADEKPARVIHLAAQAGVRYSLVNPHAYISSNVVAFTNVLEACRHNAVEHLVYASSSSVYGGNTKLPFSEDDTVDYPVSLYAATKKANELMAHTYSHLYALPTTGLRFFTVYGPWGRPDMSPILFADAIDSGKAIKVFNHGDMMRDFTYIDDIVEGVLRVLYKPPASTAVGASGSEPAAAPYRIFNIGNSEPEKLMDFIAAIEHCMGKTADKEFLPMQPGDVKATFADTAKLEEWIGFSPHTKLSAGVERFVAWYKSYYHDRI